MRGYRAERAFDGTRVLSYGALVLVDGGRIVGVQPASAAAPDGCEAVEFPGATVLPGLIDTRVHLCADSGPQALDRIPALSPTELGGIITASAPGAPPCRRDRGPGSRRPPVGGPRAAPRGRRGTHGGGRRPAADLPARALFVHGGRGVRRPGRMRVAVRERVERGAAVVKIMASGGVMTPGTDVFACQFSAEELRAAVDEAHRHGLPVSAHAHALTAVERCVEVGVDGIEHCSCMTPEGVRTPPELAVRLADDGTPVCPTLGRTAGVDLPPQMLAILESMGATCDDHLAHVATLHEAGVTLLAGTDAGIGPGKRHGPVPVAVAELVGCGVPPTVALSGATALAARACGLEERTGRLAEGLDADLLVVDGDPLADVPALERSHLVVSRGREVLLAEPS